MRNKNAKVSDPNSFVTSSGCKDRILYSSKVCPDGTIQLKPCGTEDIQEYINSFRESTDMAFILHQLAMGNDSVLKRADTFYGDFTEVPESLADALQVLIDGEAAFNQLPLETRQKFENNFRNWLFTSGQPEWMQKMSAVIPVEENKESEVVTEDVP